MKWKLAFFAQLVCMTTTVYSQEFRATLSGRITDTTGAAIVEAAVQVKNVNTNAVANAVSTADGSYQASLLQPGQYAIFVEKGGFRRFSQSGITLHISETAVVNVRLELGEVAQVLNVTADTALVQSESADRSLTIESQRIQNTPLQGRNVFANAWSSPGVIVSSQVTRLRPFDVGGTSGMRINGGQSSGNEVLIDGVSNLSGARSVAYVPSAEGTQELKVQTTSYDAAYGWTTGGVVNVVTKGGSNQYHGSAFEFLQNTLLNANTFDNNKNGLPRSSSHINTFGGYIGGPVKRDKLFFLFSYENIRQVIPDPFTTSVPTALQKQGDFSRTYYAAGALQAVYNPFTTRAGSSGSLVRDPFPNNQIPSNLINPVAAKVLSLVPLGNIRGNSVTELNNLVSNGSTRQFTDFFPQYTGRADYNITNSTRMFVRYSRNALLEERSFRYSTTSQVNIADTSGQAPNKRENHSATVQFTHILNATTILDFRIGLARYLSDTGNSLSAGYDLSALGFSPAFLGQASPNFPKFNWTNYEGAGAVTHNSNPTQTNSFQASMSKTMGRHSLRTGLEFRLLRTYSADPGYMAGNFSFDQQFTGANAIQISPSSGNAIASFLLGTPASGYIDVNSQPANQERLWSGFVQDDINLTSKLKVNVGLRWDYLGPVTDRFNALTRGFDTTSPSPLPVAGMNLKGGLLFAGINGQPRGISDPSLTNFGPRLGAAYQVNSKTVLRGGYGLIYGQQFLNPGVAPGFSQRTSLVSSIQTGVPYNTLTDPFPTGILRPVGASQGLATYIGQGINFADPKGGSTPPMTHQFSFEIQRELPGQFLVTASYVGSRTSRLPVNRSINEVSLSDLARGASYLTANVTNPFAGLVPGTSLNGATVQQYQLLRPYPQFAGITQMYIPIGTSKYDSFQAMLYKRFSAGLNFSIAYTNSKMLSATQFANAQDAQPIRQIDVNDIPQQVQINGVYELPFGKGKALLANVNPVLGRIVGGWAISGIARVQKGMPMPFPSSAVPTGLSPAIASQDLSRWFNTCTRLANGTLQGCMQGEQPVWTIQAPYTLRTWPFYLASVRNPGIFNLDASVIKNNPIGEHLNLGFRVDFLNATNTVQHYSGPTTNVTSPNFGAIVDSQTNLPRFIQLSMRLDF